jgi:hypothetical protein
MPASPSSVALKLAFSKRSDRGERAAISRHQAMVSRSRSPSGTTVLTSPISSASVASYSRLRNQISFAFFTPTFRARSEEPKPPSKLPTRGPVWPKTALSAAIVRSQTRCRM